MPSNEERRQAAREKLAKQNERREADARKRKIKAGAIAGVVVVALVAAGCYIWLPQGPRGPLRVAAENKFKSEHVTCDFQDRDPVADTHKNLPAQKQQIAARRTQVTDAQKQLATMTGDQKTAGEAQIKAFSEQTDKLERQVARTEKALPDIDKLTARNKTVSKPSGTDVPNSGTLTGTLTTNSGPIGFELDRSKAPCNVETFATLIAAKYFDNTPCVRETGGSPTAASGLFVLQCGDPSGSGVGGPGWTSPDENPSFLKVASPANPMTGGTGTSIYPAGTIAVANANQQADPQSGSAGVSNTGASQFFLVYKDSTLPPNYAVIGKMDDAGLTLLKQIAAKGIAPNDGEPAATPAAPVTDGKPKEPVTITSMALAS
ncbi:peptidylprolyl isomerase [Tsukamurella spumae]|uniref:peptidylprolyl isomerase n=1 Tax=Tsukamurella spumae TaxID=44753 RepID=A0A846WX27_9ACTN|nr:peptidylprolyl isomerase [Tsukamurella spumae]NKY16825.1 peptidylprolyl isomerase [Tsukamurella spumae]